jgi:KH domain
MYRRGYREHHRESSNYHAAVREVAVPKNLAGAIIGKGGENIRALQAGCGAKAYMDNSTGVLRITGSQSAVVEMELRVKEQLSKLITTQEGFVPSWSVTCYDLDPRARQHDLTVGFRQLPPAKAASMLPDNTPDLYQLVLKRSDTGDVEGQLASQLQRTSLRGQSRENTDR